MKNVWFWIFMVLTIAWMTVIFMFSAKDADTSTVTSYKVGRTIGRLFVPGFEQMPEDEQTAFAARIDKPVRKTAHACEYAVLGFLAMGTFIGYDTERYYKSRKTLFLISAALCILYAVSDEVHQYFVPGRACRFMDMCIDSAGVLVGTFACTVLKRVLKK